MIRLILIITAAGILLSAFSASAALLDLGGGTADEQELPGGPATPPAELELVQEQEPGGTPFVATCDDNDLLDFEGFPHGTIISDQYAADGIQISAAALSGRPDAVIVFDSNHSGTPDFDLEVGIGNMAIIPENVIDSDGDTLVDAPNDSAAGGTLTFDFDTVRSVEYVVLVDIERDGPNAITMFDEGGLQIASVPIPHIGDMTWQAVPVGVEGVKRLEVHYEDSGAIGEICLDHSPDPD